ncbi:hypothetical protein BDBG_16595 [Blastomyces gilchristii SLH14081]|uniref:Uncharacterized protein n=2 Tax=Blastomyces TaxID=229219 RepID=A0A179UE48_BLAGS|nr:uncharacterized protein BDBG_16595 [Blastomyces gilchristii SLH14081]KMW69017.1 hypothetical protein BDDG_13206 [Blastomyces dermatitidis ATCC 18188]OAT06296.1 hypothetical protein BDBG_16595 [Blastomyces gilchristii SLH14081]
MTDSGNKFGMLSLPETSPWEIRTAHMPYEELSASFIPLFCFCLSCITFLLEIYVQLVARVFQISKFLYFPCSISTDEHPHVVTFLLKAKNATVKFYNQGK